MNLSKTLYQNNKINNLEERRNRMRNKFSQPSRKILLVCIAAAIAKGGISSALAQGLADQEKDLEEIEKIIVTGTRADLQQAVTIKRNADVMVDAISASDIGSMPDQNIADSLQRVPGIQVQRNRGVAEQVSIRGLPSNFTQNLVNGRPVTTAFQDDLNNRDFQNYILPSLFTSSLEVAKSGKASMEGGIAGTVNIITQRAFELGKEKAMVNGTVNWDSNNGGIGTDISGIYSNIFADDTVGVFFGVNLVDESQGTHRSRGGRYKRLYDETPTRQLNSNDNNTDTNIIVRDSVIIENYEQQRERESLLFNLEWRPNDNFSWFNEVLYSQDRTISPRESLTFSFRGSDTYKDPETGAHDQESVFIGDQEYNSVYHSFSTAVSSQNEIQDRDRYLFTAQNVAKFFQNEDLSFTVSLSHTESEQLQERFRAVSKLKDKIEAKFDMSSIHEPTGITLYGDAADKLVDPTFWKAHQFSSGSTGVNIAHQTQQTDLKIDFNYYLEEGFIESIDFGLSYADSQMSSKRDMFNANSGELGAAGLENFPYFLVKSESGEFLDSSNNPQPNAWLQADINSALFANGGIQAFIDADTSTTKCFDCEGRRFAIDETFTNAYVQFNFASDDDDWNGNFGVRYTRTDELVQGYTQDVSAGFNRTPSDSGKLTPKVPGATVDRDRSYDDFSPSVNVLYNLAEDHIIRFAAEKAMTRPSPTNLLVNVTGLNGGEDDEGNENYSMRYNDPDINPYRSNNLNLSYSWYFGDKDLFSTALFYKDFESLIGDKIIYDDFEVTDLDTGVTEVQEFKVTSKSNIDGVKLKGIEITLQHAFTELPGLFSNTGFFANYTYINNSAPERLRNAAESNYNFIVYYDDGTWNSRISYTYRGSYLKTAAIGLEPAEYYSPYGQLTASVNYKVNKHFKVKLSARNLLDNATNYYNDVLARQYNDYGRRIGLDLRYTF